METMILEIHICQPVGKHMGEQGYWWTCSHVNLDGSSCGNRWSIYAPVVGTTGQRYFPRSRVLSPEQTMHAQEIVRSDDGMVRTVLEREGHPPEQKSERSALVEPAWGRSRAGKRFDEPGPIQIHLNPQ